VAWLKTRNHLTAITAELRLSASAVRRLQAPDLNLNDQQPDSHLRLRRPQAQSVSRMWSPLRPYELRIVPRVALYPPKPVQFVRVLVPRRMQERLLWRTSLLSEAVLNPAFSRPHSVATVWVELRPKLAITSATLPMQFDTFS
jgi:hypothetical protein